MGENLVTGLAGLCPMLDAGSEVVDYSIRDRTGADRVLVFFRGEGRL